MKLIPSLNDTGECYTFRDADNGNFIVGHESRHDALGLARHILLLDQDRNSSEKLATAEKNFALTANTFADRILNGESAEDLKKELTERTFQLTEIIINGQEAGLDEYRAKRSD